jgi:hypothetical protein
MSAKDTRMATVRRVSGPILLLGSCIVVYMVSAQYDVLERVAEFSARHERLEIDEFIVVAIFLVVILTVLLLWKNKMLQESLSEIEQLRGIIPICSECKNIRSDKGYWHRVEDYIEGHTDVTFSHGTCPECLRKMFPDEDIDFDEIYGKTPNN